MGKLSIEPSCAARLVILTVKSSKWSIDTEQKDISSNISGGSIYDMSTLSDMSTCSTVLYHDAFAEPIGPLGLRNRQNKEQDK